MININNNKIAPKWKFSPARNTGHFILLLLLINNLLVFGYSSFIKIDNYQYASMTEAERRIKCEEHFCGDSKEIWCRYEHCAVFVDDWHYSAIRALKANAFSIFLMLNSVFLCAYGAAIRYLYSRSSGSVLVFLGLILCFIAYNYSVSGDFLNSIL